VYAIVAPDVLDWVVTNIIAYMVRRDGGELVLYDMRELRLLDTADQA
jgi:hypothetical protein